MIKIISVVNQKGGVGKTTTSINFACGLAMEGYRVLLIDLDPQAHATIGLGIESESHQYAIQDVLLNKKRMQDVILKTKFNNLDIVPSNIRLDKAEQVLTPEAFKEIRLRKAICNLDYHFIVIDCRPALGTLTVNALVASNFLIVPTEVTRFSLEGFADLLDTVQSIKDIEKINGAGEKGCIKVLITKYDSRKSQTIEWFMEQLAPYKDMVFTTKIRQNEALNQAQIVQESIYTYKPTSTGAEDYKNLTKEFLSLCQN